MLMEKKMGLKISRIEELNYNLVRISLDHTIMKMTIFGVYGYRQEFFLDLRKHTLEDKNEEQYETDNHKKYRTVINNWIDEGDFIYTFRTFNPEESS